MLTYYLPHRKTFLYLAVCDKYIYFLLELVDTYHMYTVIISTATKTSLKSLRLQDLLTFIYLSLPLVTFPGLTMFL